MALVTAGSARERRPAVLASVEPRFATAEWVRLQEGAWVLLYEGQARAVVGEDERVWAAFEQAFTVDVQDRLHEIAIPTLVVAGRQDEAIPIAHSALVHAGIPQSTFVVLEESGHADPDPGSADSEKYRVAVCAFLEQLPKEGSRSAR
jgi:pimeloyl-ACP methyl ester carboxylesterase